MNGALRWAGMVLVALAALAACGLEESGSAVPADDAGPDSGTGGTTINNACFKGAKACAGADDKLICAASNDPKTGCLASTSCAECTVLNADPQCNASGQCDIAICDPGWEDCNADSADGCETLLAKDPFNCGACGTNCNATTGWGYLCELGSCVENPCDPKTTANCDGDNANGCEVDLTTDSNNCAFCGNACKLPHAKSKCGAGPAGGPPAQCVIETCDPGWTDCDGVPANGCESNITSDTQSCGGCGKVCDGTNGQPGCVNGACGIVCFAGFADCDNNVANGCEASLNFDPVNCGSCGKTCPAQGGLPTCTNGVCGVGTCPSGVADCDGNTGNGCETDVKSDPANCGACGNVCKVPTNGTAHCTGGVCGFSCNSGYAACGTTVCNDVSSNAKMCGTACDVCPPPGNGNGTPSCEGGSCKISCGGGQSACGSSCFDLKTDKNHCGSCTTVCQDPQGGTSTCVNGVCVVNCTSGQPCGNVCANVANDDNNCGACGTKCLYPADCQSGQCVCPSWLPKDCGNWCTADWLFCV